MGNKKQPLMVERRWEEQLRPAVESPKIERKVYCLHQKKVAHVVLEGKVQKSQAATYPKNHRRLLVRCRQTTGNNYRPDDAGDSAVPADDLNDF